MTSTQKLGPWLGLNNRLPDYALRKNTAQLSGNYLSIAENVDIDNAGRLRRREAESLVQAMTGAHSLYENYLVRGAVMYEITLPTYSETLVKVLTSNAPMSYVQAGDDIYYSNGTDSGRITAGGFFPLGLPTPSAPTVGAVAGTLYVGTYQVGVSFYNTVTGEEGGVSPSSNPELTAEGGLRVTLPSIPAGADKVNVYISTVNGSTPMLMGAYVGPYVDIIATPTTLRAASIRFEAPLPAGQLFMANNRLCSFKDNLLYIGVPYRFGYYEVASGYLQFPEPVALAVENQGGTYVATTAKTHWFPGDLGDVKEIVRDPLPFGAVPGTAWRHPATTDCGWFSEDGFIVANVQGEAVPVTYDILDLDAPASGVSNVRWTDGYVRVYSCGYCLNLENNRPTQYVGYDFTSFSGDYGTKSDGLYALVGSTVGVAAKVGFGRQDFGTETFKQLPTVYLGVTSDEPIQLQVVTPEHDYTYDALNSGADLRIQRVDIGKGIRANWYALTVYNQSGSAFTLATISFAPVASGRRI